MAPPLLSAIGQPPFGSSPIARPSGNPGQAADSVGMVQKAVDMLEQALPGLPAGHPIHKAVTSAISSLSKHAPPDAGSPGVGRTALMQLLQRAQQQSPMAALLAGRGGAGGMPGAGGPMPGGAMPPVPPGAGAPPMG